MGVPGLTFSMCQSGKLTEDVEKEFVEAVKYLEAKGVSGITLDCGFMVWLQAKARQTTNLPVFMSALVQLPAVTCGYSHNMLIAIMTANQGQVRLVQSPWSNQGSNQWHPGVQ